MLGRMDLSDYDPTYYLGEDSIVDFSHDRIRTLTRQLSEDGEDEVAFARRAFEFVRDEVRHSYDVGDPCVSITASETAANGVGLCYAKAHMLTALLRSHGIPAGLCYQRLCEPETEAGYVIHGLVALWLHGAWHRVDPRGNKDGVDAQFSLTEERLAWPVTPEYGEVDYPVIYVQPDPSVIAALQATDNILTAPLPETLQDNIRL